MKRWINIIVFVLLTNAVVGQGIDSIYQRIGYYTYNYMPLEKVDSFGLLQVEIKDITIDFLQNRFGDTQYEINFHQALIYSTDSLIIKDIELLKERNTRLNTIPYYDMHFSLSDPNLGISQYWLNIKLDKFGQIFHCNYPNLFGDKKGVISLQVAKAHTDSLMLSLYPETIGDIYEIELDYDETNEKLVWEVCYLKAAKDRTYICFAIDALKNELIQEFGKMKVNMSETDFCCCNTGEKIILHKTPTGHNEQ